MTAPASSLASQRPTGSMRRHHARRAAVGGVLAVVLGALGHGLLAATAGGAAAALGALAIWGPEPWLRALDDGVSRAADGLGVGLSWLLLPPIFWLFVVPLGIFTRRGRRDPLTRAQRPPTGSYWTPRREPIDDTSHPY